MRFWYILIFLAVPHFAEARVFNYKDSEVAGYIRGTGGLSQLAQDPFGNSSGTAAKPATVDGSTNFNYGAEIGFMFGLGTNFHFRIGAEFIQENPVTGPGNDPAGVPQYTLNSSVFVFNPKIGFEFVYKTIGNLRFFSEAAIGYANVTVVNDYKMTAAGTANYGADFKETMEANPMCLDGGFGLEALFTDNVTMMADVGYRYLPVNKLNYKADVKTIINPGGVAKGDTVLNPDGSNRKLNLSGFYGGLAFRFYLNFL